MQQHGLDRGLPVLHGIRHKCRMPEERLVAQSKRRWRAARKERGDGNLDCKSVTNSEHGSPAACASTAAPSFPRHRDGQCCLLQLFLMGLLKAELTLTSSPYSLCFCKESWDLVCRQYSCVKQSSALPAVITTLAITP